LRAEMSRLEAASLDDFAVKTATAEGALASPAVSGSDSSIRSNEARNLAAAASAAVSAPYYRTDHLPKAPNRTTRKLDDFDCLSCEKCVTVCPNAANFLYGTEAETVAFHDWVVDGRALRPGEKHAIVVERTVQIANFADFCNACGNCDTFCPEYGGPFIKKPNFFGSLGAFLGHEHDGFFIEQDLVPRIRGRIRGRVFQLSVLPGEGHLRFDDSMVGLVLRQPDHTVDSWFAAGPADTTGHVVDMHTYHTMRILLKSLLRMDRVHQVNVHCLGEH
jgi:putative selenate reductase